MLYLFIYSFVQGIDNKSSCYKQTKTEQHKTKTAIPCTAMLETNSYATSSTSSLLPTWNVSQARCVLQRRVERLATSSYFQSSKIESFTVLYAVQFGPQNDQEEGSRQRQRIWSRPSRSFRACSAKSFKLRCSGPLQQHQCSRRQRHASHRVLRRPLIDLWANFPVRSLLNNAWRSPASVMKPSLLAIMLGFPGCSNCYCMPSASTKWTGVIGHSYGGEFFWHFKVRMKNKRRRYSISFGMHHAFYSYEMSWKRLDHLALGHTMTCGGQNTSSLYPSRTNLIIPQEEWKAWLVVVGNPNQKPGTLQPAPPPSALDAPFLKLSLRHIFFYKFLALNFWPFCCKKWKAVLIFCAPNSYLWFT